MSSGPGWIGTNRQVAYFLRTVGADQDEQGRFLLSNDGVYSFLGDTSENSDALVASDTCYLVDGKPVNLAAALGTTSYGMRITVIA